MVQTKVYYYIKNAEKEAALRKLCRDLKILCVKLEVKDLNRELAEVAAGSAGSGPRITPGSSGRPLRGVMPGAGALQHLTAPVFYNMPELLIFGGMNSDALDVFLEEYKKAGISPVDHKAILTPYNMNWTVYELCEHLKKEVARQKGSRAGEV